jgi:hypothetical protein
LGPQLPGFLSYPGTEGPLQAKMAERTQT